MKIWRMTGALGNVAPAEHDLAFAPDRALELLFAGGAGGGLLRQEDHADAVVADCGKLNALRTHLLAVEGVRNLNENARAVAAERIGAHGASMVEVVQNQQRIFNDLVRRPALDVDDGTHAARVVLEFRAIKPFEAGFAPGLLFLSGHNLALQCFYFWGDSVFHPGKGAPDGPAERKHGDVASKNLRAHACGTEIFEKPANTGWQTA